MNSGRASLGPKSVQSGTSTSDVVAVSGDQSGVYALSPGRPCVKLRVLGSSGTYPVADCPSSGYLLDAAGTRIWIDAGTGTFAELQRCIDYVSIDAMILTHLHSDHCLDLLPFYYARRFNERAKKLPLYCAPGTEKHMSQLLIGDGGSKLSTFFDFRDVRPGDSLEIGDVGVSFEGMQHPVPTTALKLEADDQVLAFSADTGPDAPLAQFVSGSDVLLCEASYQNADVGPPIHLSAAQAAQIGAEADVQSLILTHIFPTLDPEVSLAEARDVGGDLDVSRAIKGEVFDVGALSWINSPR